MACNVETILSDAATSGFSKLADRNKLDCLLQLLCDIASTPSGVAWGAITGTLSDQLDLQAALNAKASVTLNNLTSPTSVNQSLIPSDATKDIGAGGTRWNKLYFDNDIDQTGGATKLNTGGTVNDFVFGASAITATGRPMLAFDHSKKAFRCGQASGTEWSDANTGVVSFAAGYRLRASGYASFAAGWNYGFYISATATASFAHGFTAYGGQIYASAKGSFAAGYSGTYAGISALGPGAFAHGYAGTYGYINASQAGNIAMGSAGYVYGLSASGLGAMVFGRAYNTGIVASAANSAQFFEGTNAQANSLSVGTTIRLKGTTAAPSTPRNGDIWVANNYVYVRSNGVSCKCVNASM